MGQVEKAGLHPRRLLGSLAFCDVDHHPAKPGRLVALDHDGHQVAQPNDLTVCGDHAVFKVVIPFFRDRRGTRINSPLAIDGIDVILPERRLAQPALDRVTEDALGLLAYEQEFERHCIGLPDDPIDGVDQIAEPVLRGLRLDARRLLTSEQLLTFFFRSLALGDVIIGLQEGNWIFPFELQRPSARHHDLRAVAASVDQFPLPAARPG